jgi:hypothetical protein
MPVRLQLRTAAKEDCRRLAMEGYRGLNGQSDWDM